MRRLLALLVLAVVPGLVLAMSPAQSSPDSWGASVRLEVETVDAGGVRTAYAFVGPTNGPALLLLNGTGSPMAQWDPALLAGLARDHRVLVYDYPGLGGSAALPGTLSFDTLSDHAADLLDSVGLPNAAVLGWSMGGFVAQRLAVRHPERVTALVLAATNAGGPSTLLGPRWVQEQDSDPDASTRDYVRANYPPGQRGRGWAFVRRVDAAVASGRYPPERIPARVYDAMVAAEEPWLESDANLRDLERITAATLVVTGRDDVVTPRGNSRVLARAIPGADLTLVPASGHSFLFQHPARTSRLVAAFLERGGPDVSPAQ